MSNQRILKSANKIKCHACYRHCCFISNSAFLLIDIYFFMKYIDLLYKIGIFLTNFDLFIYI